MMIEKKRKFDASEGHADLWLDKNRQTGIQIYGQTFGQMELSQDGDRRSQTHLSPTLLPLLFSHLRNTHTMQGAITPLYSSVPFFIGSRVYRPHSLPSKKR